MPRDLKNATPKPLNSSKNSNRATIAPSPGSVSPPEKRRGFASQKGKRSPMQSPTPLAQESPKKSPAPTSRVIPPKVIVHDSDDDADESEVESDREEEPDSPVSENSLFGSPESTSYELPSPSDSAYSPATSQSDSESERDVLTPEPANTPESPAVVTPPKKPVTSSPVPPPVEKKKFGILKSKTSPSPFKKDRKRKMNSSQSPQPAKSPRIEDFQGHKSTDYEDLNIDDFPDFGDESLFDDTDIITRPPQPVDYVISPFSAVKDHPVQIKKMPAQGDFGSHCVEFVYIAHSSFPVVRFESHLNLILPSAFNLDEVSVNLTVPPEVRDLVNRAVRPLGTYLSSEPFSPHYLVKSPMFSDKVLNLKVKSLKIVDYDGFSIPSAKLKPLINGKNKDKTYMVPCTVDLRPANYWSFPSSSDRSSAEFFGGRVMTVEKLYLDLTDELPFLPKVVTNFNKPSYHK